MNNQSKIKFSKQLKEWILVFLIIGIITTVGNAVGFGFGFLEALPGILIFGIISVLGLSLKFFIPYNIPSVVYISLIGLIIVLPFSPLSETIIYWTNKVDLMALATPVLAYAGVVVGRDWKDFKEVGWRGFIVSLLVIIGTFLVSGGIAELFMKI